MKRFIPAAFFIFTMAYSAIAFSGCKPSGPTATPPAAADTSAKLDQAKQDTKAAVENLNDYAYAKRIEYTQKMRDELAELNKEIDDLGAKIAQGTDDVKTAAQPKLDALHAQADKLKAQLDKAEDASETGWTSFKADCAKGYDDLKKSVNDARQWLSDKIAPKNS